MEDFIQKHNSYILLLLDTCHLNEPQPTFNFTIFTFWVLFSSLTLWPQAEQAAFKSTSQEEVSEVEGLIKDSLTRSTARVWPTFT